MGTLCTPFKGSQRKTKSAYPISDPSKTLYLPVLFNRTSNNIETVCPLKFLMGLRYLLVGKDRGSKNEMGVQEFYIPTLICSFIKIKHKNDLGPTQVK